MAIFSSKYTGSFETTGSFGRVDVDSNVTAESFTGIFEGALSSSSQIAVDISGSFAAPSASFSTRTTNLEVASASFSTRVSTEEANVNTLQGRNINTGMGLTGGGDLTDDRTLSIDFSDSTFATGISGSFTTTSASFSTRITDATASIASLKTASGSFSTRTSTLETTMVAEQTNIDNLQVASASFSTRVTNLKTDSGSFSTRVSANEAFLNQSVKTDAEPTFAGLTIEGKLTTQELIVSSSVTSMSVQQASGSTRFGDDINDTHRFSGSLFISGSSVINGHNVLSGSSQIASEISGAFTAASASFSTRITTEEGNVDTLQARNINTGTGLSGGGDLTSDRTLAVDFSDSTFASAISGSFTNVSASLSTRITNATASIAALKSDSGSFSTRITNATASIAALKSDSGSFSTRVSTNEGFLNQSVKTDAEPTFAGVTSTGNIIGDLVEIIEVTVDTSSGNRYKFEGQIQPDFQVDEGKTYRFDQSDNSNNNHPFRFSQTENGTHGGGSEYTTNVTTNGTPGQAGAYTQIKITKLTPNHLYYYCTYHGGMGGDALVLKNDLTNLHIVSGSSVSTGSFGKILGDGSDLTGVGGFPFTGSAGILGSLNVVGDIHSTQNISGSSVSASNLSIDAIRGNWTNAGNTVADLGSITTVDINGGSIDGVSIATSNITVGTGKTLNISDGTLTLADDQISGDKVEGGTIAATTITSLTSTTVTSTNVTASNALSSSKLDTGEIKLDGTNITATATEINFLSGVTSNVKEAYDTVAYATDTGVITFTEIDGGTDTIDIGVGTADSPSFTGLTISGLTNSKLLGVNGSGVVGEKNLNDFVGGTSNRITVSDDGDGTITLSTPQDTHTSATPTFASLTLTAHVTASGNISGSSTSTGSFGRVDASHIEAPSIRTRRFRGFSPIAFGDDINVTGSIEVTSNISGSSTSIISSGDYRSLNNTIFVDGSAKAFGIGKAAYGSTSTDGAWFSDLASANGFVQISVNGTNEVLSLNQNSTGPILLGKNSGTEKFRVKADGNVTASLGGKFGGVLQGTKIQTSNGGGPQLVNSTPNATTPSIYPTMGDTNTGIGYGGANGSTADNINLITGGTTGLYIDSSQNVVIANGNVGIGDTSPEAKLTVKGTSDSYKAFFGDTDDTVKVGIYTAKSDPGATKGSIGTQTNHALGLIAGDADRVTILPSGNVGIGTNNPTYTLDVVGNMGVNGAIIHNDDTDTYIQFSTNKIGFYTGNSGNVADFDITRNLISGSSSSTGSFGHGHFDGNVGIGTQSPSNTLHTYANVSSEYAALIENDQATSGHGLQIHSDGNGTGTILFDVDAAGSSRFRVRGDGSVLVGFTTSQAEKLAVQGDFRATGNISGSATSTGSFAQLRLPQTGKLILDSNGGTFLYEKTNNDVRMVVGETESALFLAAGFGTPATQKLYLDGGGNTYFQESSADNVKLYVGGSELLDVNTDGLRVFGDLTAERLIVSSSVTNLTIAEKSGSTIFGDSTDDTHVFTGSVNITGSATATSFIGDGSQLTGLTAAAITTYNSAADNRIITSVDSTTVQGESSLTFNGVDLVFGKGSVAGTAGSIAHHTNDFLYIYGGTEGLALMAHGGIDGVKVRDGGGSGNGSVVIETANTERMRVNGSGNVGIGTDNPQAISGNNQLHLHKSDSGDNYIHFTNGTTGVTNSDGFKVGINGGEQGVIWNNRATDLIFGTSNSERMRIHSNGKVGINQSNPLHQLDVDGTTRITGVLTAGGHIKLADGSNFYLDGGSNTYIKQSSSDVISFYTGGIQRFNTDYQGITLFANNSFLKGKMTNNAIRNLIGLKSNNTIGIGHSGMTVFFENNVTIESGGDVGIGTTNPESLLHIFTADASIAPNADADELVIENSGNAGISILSGNTSNGAIYFGDAQDNNIGMIDYDHALNKISLTAGATNLPVFSVTSNTAEFGPSVLKVSGSAVSTGSFGKLLGDGSDITGISSFTVANSSNNRIITSVDSSNGNAEANLTFDGTDLTLSGGAIGITPGTDAHFLRPKPAPNGYSVIRFNDGSDNALWNFGLAGTGVANQNLYFYSYGNSSTVLELHRDTGRVGIGLTFGADPVSLLQVGGDVTVNGSISGSEVSASTYFGDGSNLTGISAFPFTGSAGISGSLLIDRQAANSGSTVFDVNGSQGNLFNLVDNFDGELFSVRNKVGAPLFIVNSDNTLDLGPLGDPLKFSKNSNDHSEVTSSANFSASFGRLNVASKILLGGSDLNDIFVNEGDIQGFPFTGSIAGISGSLAIDRGASNSGSSVFTIDGSQGRLFEIVDDNTDNFFKVTNGAGLELFKVTSGENIEFPKANQKISGSVTSTGSFGRVFSADDIELKGNAVIFNISDGFVTNAGGAMTIQGTGNVVLDAGAGADEVTLSTTALTSTVPLTVNGNVSGSATSTGSFGQVITAASVIPGNYVFNDVDVNKATSVVLGPNAFSSADDSAQEGDNQTLVAIGSGVISAVERTKNSVYIGANVLSGYTGGSTRINSAVVIGKGAGTGMAAASNMTIIGADAGSTTAGANSVMIGRQANAGQYGTSIGYQAGGAESNVSIGSFAGAALGHSGVYIGYQAGSNINNGLADQNTFLGNRAGKTNTAGSNLVNTSNTILIGHDTHATEDGTNEIVIGTNAEGAGSNTTVIGNSSQTHVIFGGGAIISGSATSTGSFGHGNFDGNVGIGTKSSSKKLEVFKESEPRIRVTSGNSGNPAYEWAVNNDRKWVFYSAQHLGTNTMYFKTNTTNIMALKQDGDVGIGNDSPSFKLDVSGTGRFTGTLTTAAITTTGITSTGNISGSATSTGSFGKLIGDGSSLTGVSAFPFTGSAGISGSLSIDRQATTSGSTLLDVKGTQGTLFSVVDNMSGSIFSANTVAGIPVIEAFSNGDVHIGPSGSSFSRLFLNGSTVSTASGAGGGSGTGFPFTGSAGLSGSLEVKHLQAATGSTMLSVVGSEGTLFSVVNSMTGSIFSANTTAGIPVIEAFSDGDVTFGPLTSKISGSSISTGSFGKLLVNDMSVPDVKTVSSSLADRIAALSAASSGITISNNVNNRVLTGDGSNANAEANLTFSGTTLTINNYEINNPNTSTATFNNSDEDITTTINGVGGASNGGSFTVGDGKSLFTGQNVGIGTTGPLANVDISGANVVTNSRGNLFIRTNDSYAINKGGQITFGGIYTGTSNAGWASVAGRKENGGNNDYSAYLSFGTAANGGLLTEKMRITSTGNVGIGDTSPGASLVVVSSAGNTARFGTTTDGVNIGHGSGFGFIQGTDTEGSAFNHLRFRTASDYGMILTTGNLVGIGTMSPSSTLHVKSTTADGHIIAESTHGTSSGVVDIRSVAGRDSFIIFREGTTAKAQIFNDASNDAVVLTDGSNANTIHIKGSNVGIGDSSPEAKLTVKGTADSYKAFFGDTDDTVKVGIYTQKSDPGAAKGSIGTSTNHPLGLIANNADRVTILPSGNVGIGTHIPGELLDVNGDIRVRGAGGSIGGTTIGNAALIIGSTTNGIGVDANELLKKGGDLYFGVIDDDDIFFRANNSTRMFIQSGTGNVGVGAGTPTEKLTVFGNIKATGDIIAERLIVSSSVSVITQSFSSGSTIFGDTGDDTHQFTGSLFVTGSIGFNTTSPDAKLHLNTPADGKAMQFDRAGQETYRLSHGVSGLFFSKPNSVGLAYGVTQDGDFDTFDASGNRIIRSDASSGNVGINNLSPSEKLDVTGNVKATAFLEQSSVRYKENIETLESPLEKITKLRGVSYNLIENKEPNIGMIAEEVNEIFPELVNKDDSGEVQSMSYTRMTAVLLEAVKELTKEVKELKKVNTYYKNKEEK